MPKPAVPPSSGGIDTGALDGRVTGMCCMGCAAQPSHMGESKMTTALKTGMNSRNLKKHLKYIVPEMRLALIKEPGVKPQAVLGPDDLERFVEPLKH